MVNWPRSLKGRASGRRSKMTRVPVSRPSWPRVGVELGEPVGQRVSRAGAPHLELDGFALYLPAAVDDPLQPGHEHELGCHLVIGHLAGQDVPVRAPEGGEFRDAHRGDLDVERAGGAQPGRVTTGCGLVVPIRLAPDSASISSRNSTIGRAQLAAQRLSDLFSRPPGGASGHGSGGCSSGGRSSSNAASRIAASTCRSAAA